MSEVAKRGKGRGKGDADTPQPVGAPIQQTAKPVKNDDDDAEPDGGMSVPLPICGGWFCPNENPDETCFRRFSNELTVPCNPCIMRCPTLFETNKFCFIVGRFAFQVSTLIRKLLFFIALLLSLAGMGLFAYSIAGAFAAEDMIRNNAWVKVTRQFTTGGGGAMTNNMISSFTGAYIDNPEQAVDILVKSGFRKECVEYDLAKSKKSTETGNKNAAALDAMLLKENITCPCNLSGGPPSICSSRAGNVPAGGEKFEMTWFASPFGRITEFKFAGANSITKNKIKDIIDEEYLAAENARFIGWANQQAGIDGNFFGAGHDLDGTKNKLVYVHWQGDTCLAGQHFRSAYCANDTLPMIFILCILGFLAQISASMADCQRWTEYGDINCQKFNGWFSAVLVCASAFSAWFQWGKFEFALEHEISVPIGGAAYLPFVKPEDGTLEIDSCILKLFLLIIGCCKIYDILVHCIVATPVGRHAKWDEGNEPAEMVDYLLRFRDPNDPELPYSATH